MRAQPQRRNGHGSVRAVRPSRLPRSSRRARARPRRAKGRAGPGGSESCAMICGVALPPGEKVCTTCLRDDQALRGVGEANGFGLRELAAGRHPLRGTRSCASRTWTPSTAHSAVAVVVPVDALRHASLCTSGRSSLAGATRRRSRTRFRGSSRTASRAGREPRRGSRTRSSGSRRSWRRRRTPPQSGAWYARPHWRRGGSPGRSRDGSATITTRTIREMILKINSRPARGPLLWYSRP